MFHSTYVCYAAARTSSHGMVATQLAYKTTRPGAWRTAVALSCCTSRGVLAATATAPPAYVQSVNRPRLHGNRITRASAWRRRGLPWFNWSLLLRGSSLCSCSSASTSKYARTPIAHDCQRTFHTSFVPSRRRTWAIQCRPGRALPSGLVMIQSPTSRWHLDALRARSPSPSQTRGRSPCKSKDARRGSPCDSCTASTSLTSPHSTPS
jgi:hypothetical protein